MAHALATSLQYNQQPLAAQTGRSYAQIPDPHMNTAPLAPLLGPSPKQFAATAGLRTDQISTSDHSPVDAAGAATITRGGARGPTTVSGPYQTLPTGHRQTGPVSRDLAPTPSSCPLVFYLDLPALVERPPSPAYNSRTAPLPESQVTRLLLPELLHRLVIPLIVLWPPLLPRLLDI